MVDAGGSTPEFVPDSSRPSTRNRRLIVSTGDEIMSRRRKPVDRRSHRVSVEVIVLRATAAGLAYRRRVAPLEPDADPDRAATVLVGGEPAVLHSTSWRRDPAGCLLLTYAALPDPRPEHAAVPLVDTVIAVGQDPRRPSPAVVGVDQVAAHAVRHLELLRRTDPVVAAALGAHPALEVAVAAAEPAPAGQLR